MVLLSKLVVVSSRVRPAGIRPFCASSLRTVHVANRPAKQWSSNPNNDVACNGKSTASMHQGMQDMRKGEKWALPSCERRRLFSTSFLRLDDKKPHTADSYFKDVDHAPPPSEKTYQVDSGNPTVQRPNEQMSGEYSRAGPKTKEYATVEGGTYDVPPSTGPEKDQKSRYGSTQRYYDEDSSGSKVSKPDEGPAGVSAGGRKPEGRP